MNTTIERTTVAALLSTALALPLAHGLALLLRSLLPAPEPVGAWTLSAGVLAAGLCTLAVRLRWPRRPEVPLTVLSAAGTLSLIWLGAALGLAAVALALVLVVPFQLGAAVFLERRLPVSWDGARRRSPLVAGLWVLAALLALGQTARISSFMSDAEAPFGPTLTGYFDHHMCLPAYMQAAEMNLHGTEDVYDPAHYPGLNPDAAPTTAVAGMQPYVEDPYQYPPTFLLLPHALVRSGAHFDTVRTGWFVLQLLGFAAVAALLVRWVGGRTGLFALMLLPLVWLAPATNFNFQYGQFHLVTVVLAVAGMLCFERGRESAGGLLLAAAVGAKLFPGLLVVHLIARGRWRAVAWTSAWGLALVASAWLTLGAAPFQAFFAEHLPRLADGSAFAFDQAWPELRALLVAGNQSPLGFVDKLVELGFAGARGLAPLVNGGYLLLVVAVAALSGRRAGGSAPRARANQAALWLALLTLGAMQSGGAWAEYINVSTLWMLTFVSATAPRSRISAVLLSLVWGYFLVLPGSIPLPAFPSEPWMMGLSAGGFLLAVGLCTRVALRAPELAPRAVPVPVRGALAGAVTAEALPH